MAYVITELCVGTCDTACVGVCPTECIAGPLPVDDLRALPDAERAARTVHMQLYIDPEDCIDCGACVSECPVDAIFHEDDVPAASRGSIEANAEFFRARRG